MDVVIPKPVPVEAAFKKVPASPTPIALRGQAIERRGDSGRVAIGAHLPERYLSEQFRKTIRQSSKSGVEFRGCGLKAVGGQVRQYGSYRICREEWLSGKFPHISHITRGDQPALGQSLTRPSA